MQAVQTEVTDEQDSSIEHKNSTVTTAGTPVTVTRTDGKNITLVYIKNPNKGLRANNMQDVLYISCSGVAPSANGISLSRGEYVYIPGMVLAVNGLKIDANNNNVKAEIILWG